MIVALDATYAVDEEPTGIAVYSRMLIEHLLRVEPAITLRLYFRPHRFPAGHRYARTLGLSSRLLLEHWPLRGAGVFHALNQRVPAGRLPPVVCTFHDLFVITGDYSSPDFRRRFRRQAQEAARRTDLFIAVSRFTASQLCELLSVDPSRVYVVHHGCRYPVLDRVPQKRKPYVLFVGAIQRRKNTARLVQAFQAAAPGWKLILAGGYGYGAEETLEAINRSPRRDDIIVKGYTSEAELRQLYTEASVFAFPSLDEGFGIPALEAMAFGLPVIASNRSALPEVCGEAAVYVDPFNTEELANAIYELTRDEALRARLSEKSLIRARLFRWEDTCEKTVEVYRLALAGK